LTMELAATMRRLWKLSWLELKIFVREPLGFVGSIGVPVVLSLALASVSRPGIAGATRGAGQGLPAFSPVITAMSAVAPPGGCSVRVACMSAIAVATARPAAMSR